MRALVTGASGFIGSHLTDFLLEKGMEVYGTVYKERKNLQKDVHIIKCDVSKAKDVVNAVKKSRPDVIFHMAAQSFVVPSWKDPESTMNSNAIGTLNILEASRNKDIIVHVACSSAEYGTSHKEEIPIKEENPLRPTTPYAVSKVATDVISHIYYKAYGMKVFRIRFFNITGPRKEWDAVSDFARGIVEVEQGKRKHLGVGNLHGIRDFTDVRDAVKAVWTINEKGNYGNVYNICTADGRKVSDILDTLLSMSTEKIVVKESSEKTRKIDDPIFVGSNAKIKKLGWNPTIPLEKTLQDTLEYWRNEIK